FDMAKAAAREAMAVARATGVSVPDAVIDDVDRAYRALPGHMKSSMLEDLERGRPLELPWLSGAVVRLGRGAGVDTPIHRFITAVLSPHVHGAARERANAAPSFFPRLGVAPLAGRQFTSDSRAGCAVLGRRAALLRHARHQPARGA